LLFSLVLCTFNTQYNLLERAIESLKNFTSSKFELIIVNDGSDDKHTEQLLKLVEKSNFLFNFKIYHTQNKGLSAARNHGIQKSSGLYVGFMDSDDQYYLKNVMDLLGLMKFTFDIIEFSIETSSSDGRHYKTINSEIEISSNNGVLNYFEEILKKNKYFAPAPYRVYRREYLILNNLYFYEGILHEDEEWMPRVYFAASSLYVSSVFSYHHFQTTPSSLTRTTDLNIKKNRAIGLLEASNSMVNLSNRMKGSLNKTFKNYIAKTYLQIPLHSPDISLNRLLPLMYSNDKQTFLKSILFIFGNRFYLKARSILKGK